MIDADCRASHRPTCWIVVAKYICKQSRYLISSTGVCADLIWLVLTRSPANAEGPREHSVSWNLVKCCTNVWRIAFEKGCNLWMTFKVIQGHCCCCQAIYDFLLISNCKYISISHRFWDINTQHRDQAAKKRRKKERRKKERISSSFLSSFFLSSMTLCDPNRPQTTPFSTFCDAFHIHW